MSYYDMACYMYIPSEDKIGWELVCFCCCNVLIFVFFVGSLFVDGELLIVSRFKRLSPIHSQTVLVRYSFISAWLPGEGDCIHFTFYTFTGYFGNPTHNVGTVLHVYHFVGSVFKTISIMCSLWWYWQQYVLVFKVKTKSFFLPLYHNKLSFYS